MNLTPFWTSLLASLPGWGAAIAAATWNAAKTRRHVTKVTQDQTQALGEIAKDHATQACRAYHESDYGDLPADELGPPRPGV